jgi:tryptophan halogenase
MHTVVVVGGGTAGWLTACVIAAERRAAGDMRSAVVLIESPDIPTIGVGEGTWPSLRTTLRRICFDEVALFREADASFKQGTCFLGWSGGGDADRYYHPFSLPAGYAATNLAQAWLANGGVGEFAGFVTPQSAVIDRGLAPKQAAMPDYAIAVNYAYHLDAGRFADLLRVHAVERLGVRHVRANVVRIEGAPDADIEAVMLDTGGREAGDLFVDCTGHRALLLGEHYGVPLLPVGDVLFNDSAIAAQVPYADPQSPIPCTTNSTATPAGWIWDIALQSRRGIGHMYASSFTSEDEARRMLADYVGADPTLKDTDSAGWRTLRFQPSYRARFWERNCVAVGLSAGFIEPLEASAIALIEQSAALIARQLPRERAIMDAVARQFNDKLAYHWQRIIEFLKLHYAVSRRDDSEYWRAHRCRSSWPQSLADKLLLWRQQTPYHQDAPMLDELFPSASYQYVLYGMGFRPQYMPACTDSVELAQAAQDVQTQSRRLVAGLTPNRSLIQELVGR